MTDFATAVATADPEAAARRVAAQLRALEQLTHTEAQIARMRVGQAHGDAVRRELRENADGAARRARRIAEQLRALPPRTGPAVPDVVLPTFGRVLALVRSMVEQVQPIDEVLLGDLALAHQLLDRSRYLRVLADRAGMPAVEKLADDLVAAHTRTVEWLASVLDEAAIGGPVVLEPTAVQRLAGGVAQAVRVPTRFTVAQAGRVVETAYWTGEQARDMAERVVRLGAGPREDAGTVAPELPIPQFEEMTAPQAIAAIRSLTDPEDVHAVIAFEQSHHNRGGVLAAARAKEQALAGTGP